MESGSHNPRPNGSRLRIAVRPGKSVVYIVSGEFAFVALMLTCYAIEPSSKAVRRGLSYYGNSLTTGVPYAVAFAFFIAMTALALTRLEAGSTAVQRFRFAVAGVLALMALVPLTPYAVDVIFDWLHTGFVSALFIAALVLGTWLALRLRDRVTRILFLTESIAGITIVAAQMDLNDYMIPSELLFQLASFGLLLQGMRHLAVGQTDDTGLQHEDREPDSRRVHRLCS